MSFRWGPEAEEDCVWMFGAIGRCDGPALGEDLLGAAIVGRAVRVRREAGAGAEWWGVGVDGGWMDG